MGMATSSSRVQYKKKVMPICQRCSLILEDMNVATYFLGANEVEVNFKIGIAMRVLDCVERNKMHPLGTYIQFGAECL